MSFILPEVPSFGQQLARGLGQGISQGVGSAANLLSEATKQKMKSRSLLDTLSQLRKEGENGGINDLTAEQQGLLANQYPEFVKAYQTAQKLQQPEKEKMKRGESLLDTIESLRDKVDYVGHWFGIKTFGGPLRRETVQKRNEIDSEVADLMAYLKELDTKGQLPFGLFKQLEKKLPSSDLSEREYKGRLDAFEKIIRRNFLGETKGKTKGQEISSNKASTEPMVKMQAEDGSIGMVPKNRVSDAMKKGAKVIR